MGRRICPLIPASSAVRKVYAAAILLFFAALELLLYYFDTSRYWPDRFTVYCTVLFVSLLFHRSGMTRRKVMAVFIVLLPLSGILTVHGALIFGNGMGFSLENFLFVCSKGALREILLLSTSYCLKTLFLIFVLAAGMTGTALVCSLVLRPVYRNAAPWIKRSFAAGCLVGGILTFAPLKDGLDLLLSISTEVKFWQLAPEVYVPYGIKVTSLNAEDVKASPGKNLVFVIMESTERTYLDQSLFPGLVPNLSAFARKSHDFTNLAMAPNATVTHSAMYSMMAGAYMTGSYLFQKGIETSNPNVGSRLSSLPKILHQAGYRQYFLVGCSGNFAGLENFVKGERYDVAWFGADRSVPENRWSFCVRDSGVYEQAWRFFQEAASGGKPFNITLLTIDAHGPDGMYDPSEPAYPQQGAKINKLYNAMYASDAAFGKFVKRIAAHPAGKDTCIAVVSDHLAHYFTNTVDVLDRNPARKLLFLIYNSARETFRPDVPGKTFDIAPTILDALGVRHDYLFPVGESLYGSPSEKRLVNSMEQSDILGMYVAMKSRFPVELPCDIRLLSSPYPSVAFGNLLHPLFVRGCIDLPEAGRVFFFPVPKNRTIWNVAFRYRPTLASFEMAACNCPEYIFIAGNTPETARKYQVPDRKGYLVGIRINGRTLVKYGPPDALPAITSQEIADLLKR